ncbi:MAG: GNAT family N-acetyltransferase [Planctomycetes bacterium]|nr:GNAT family N-acetyltransferase [Planctomycetota bacterium]
MHRRSLAELDHATSAWNRAAAQAAQIDPFCCRTEWQFSFHEAFYPHLPLHLRERAGSIIAFAEHDDAGFGPLLAPVESHWLFGSPLLGTDAVALLTEFLAERTGDGPSPSLLLSGLSADGPTVGAITASFGRRYLIHRLAPTTLCSASLAGGLDGYLSRRSGSWRRNLGQAARRAAALGVTFERCRPRDAEHAAAVYDRMIAVERTSWKGIGRCGMAEPPSLDFYGRMLRRLAASGGGRVMFARHEERDIGFIFGGLAGAVYRGQQFSYAEEWSRCSIGNLLQLEQLRWLCEEGIGRYDMGPDMPYKQHWTEIRTDIEARLLQPRSR